MTPIYKILHIGPGVLTGEFGGTTEEIHFDAAKEALEYLHNSGVTEHLGTEWEVISA